MSWMPSSCLAFLQLLPALLVCSLSFSHIISYMLILQWQQAGRAGRRSRDSLIVFVADSLPIDQHYVENPGQLFEKASDDLIVDLESKVIVEGRTMVIPTSLPLTPCLLAHLQCAGYEMPLSLEDEKYFGPMTRELCETYLLRDEDGWQELHYIQESSTEYFLGITPILNFCHTRQKTFQFVR